MAEQIWDKFLTERDKQVFEASGYGVHAGPGKKPALLVIDVNYNFCGDKREPILESIKHWRNSCGEDAWDALPQIRKLIDKCREKGVPVIYTRYIFRADYADGGVLVKYLLPALGESDHLAAGTLDIEVVDDIAPQDGDYIVDKNRPSSFYATGLEPILNGLDTDSLVVCGVTTNCCVETTVRDASQRDYKTFVVTDATGELEQERHDFAINTMAFLFADAVTVDDMIQIWQSKQSSAA